MGRNRSMPWSAKFLTLIAWACAQLVSIASDSQGGISQESSCGPRGGEEICSGQARNGWALAMRWTSWLPLIVHVPFGTPPPPALTLGGW